MLRFTSKTNEVANFSVLTELFWRGKGQLVELQLLKKSIRHLNHNCATLVEQMSKSDDWSKHEKIGFTCFWAVTHSCKRQMTARITMGWIPTAQIAWTCVAVSLGWLTCVAVKSWTCAAVKSWTCAAVRLG